MLFSYKFCYVYMVIITIITIILFLIQNKQKHFFSNWDFIEFSVKNKFQLKMA